MRRTVFLITSSQDIQRVAFADQLARALREADRVDLLVVTLELATVWKIRADLNRLATRNPAVAQANFLTLADSFAADAGRVLSTKERQTVDLSQCEERLFMDHSQQVKRYLRSGQLVAELRQLDDETPMILRQYDQDRLVQTVTYGLDGSVVALAKVRSGVAQTQYLLNRRGEAVLRLTRQTRTRQHVLNLRATSGMIATLSPEERVVWENERAQQQSPLNGEDQTVLIPATEIMTSGVVYADYRRFTSSAALYHIVLNRTLTPNSQLFVPLTVNPSLSPLLPNQLIFNY